MTGGVRESWVNQSPFEKVDPESRVFASVRSHHDWKAAEPFGELVFCLPAGIGIENFEGLKSALRASLERERFNPDHDLVAITGPLVIVTLFFGLLLIKYGRLRALAYRGGAYFECVIDARDEREV